MNREATKNLLMEYGLTPNRALGQNFLADDRVLEAIVGATDLSRGVLEIGPGLGALTERLLAAPALAAVEIDEAMVRVLSARFAGRANLTLLREDFLKTDLQKLQLLLGDQVSVAANLPYYVTTPISLRLLEWSAVSSMTLMLQKEAAARFFARPGEKIYGPLSVLAACRYEVKKLMDVPRTCYEPRPEVDSTVLLLTRRDTPFTLGLLPLLNAAFAMRRKTLQNNLKGRIGPEKMSEAGIDPGRRAESLLPEEFLQLEKILKDG